MRRGKEKNKHTNMNIEDLVSISDNEELASLLTCFFESTGSPTANGEYDALVCVVDSSMFSQTTFRCAAQQGFEITNDAAGKTTKISFDHHFVTIARRGSVLQRKLCLRALDILRRCWQARHGPKTDIFHYGFFDNRYRLDLRDFFVLRGFAAIEVGEETVCVSTKDFRSCRSTEDCGTLVQRQPNMRLPVVAQSLSLLLPRDVIVHVILPYVSRN